MGLAVRRWWRQLWCLHVEAKLTGIMRDSETYRRWGMFHCPTCDKDWRSTRLPNTINRERPWS
jgi:hypothetical protein